MDSELIDLRTGDRDVVLDLTDRCADFVADRGDGLLHVFVPHATAGIAVLETGAIGRAWKTSGHEHGYGYPVTDEIRSGATVHQRFSHGYQVNWSSLTGQVWVTGW